MVITSGIVTSRTSFSFGPATSDFMRRLMRRLKAATECSGSSSALKAVTTVSRPRGFCGTTVRVGLGARTGRPATPGRRARAVGLVMLGLTGATLAGVPIAAWLGQIFGWRAAFVFVGLVAALAIVMLRRAPNEAAAHYLSVDLVLATNAELEKEAKEHLPLLRSIVVSALSTHTLAEANAMTVDQYAALLNKTFNANYEKENHEKPFSEVMVGKLIIE